MAPQHDQNREISLDMSEFQVADGERSNVDNVSGLRACADQGRRKVAGSNLLEWQANNHHDALCP
jgi:hypothetical protein